MEFFNLEFNSSLLNSLNNPIHHQCLHSHELIIFNNPSNHQLLNILSILLSRPCLTTTIIKISRPFVLDLIARWIDFNTFDSCPTHSISPNNSSPKHDVHGHIKPSPSAPPKVEIIINALAIILPIVPQASSFSVQLLASHPYLFDFIDSLTLENPIYDSRLRILIKSLYRLLSFSPSTFISLWSWKFLYKLLQHHDPFIQAYSAESLVIVLGMSDDQKWSFLKKFHNFQSNPDLDAYFAPIASLSETFDSEINRLDIFSTIESISDSSIVIKSSDFSRHTADVCGVLLPRFIPDQISNKTSNTILTSNASKCIKSIGLAISLKMPILIQGTSGCGKTAILEHAAFLTGRTDILKIHLGDQSDSKMLLGTYICTSAPGVFKWQPGILTKAVSEGRWILIEDIDHAPIEILSLLLPLLESRILFIPGRGEQIKAKDGFRIFATQTLYSSARNSNLGENLWTKIQLDPYPEDEIKTIISNRFSNISEWTDTIYSTYLNLVELFESKRLGLRSPTMRDLMKCCNRLSKNVTPEIISQDRFNELIFIESLDCFVCGISKHDIRMQIIEFLGNGLKIPQHRIDFFVENYVPEISCTNEKFQIGRSKISIHNARASLISKTYAPTPQSSRLLEKIITCLSFEEPILLVGETGTGKTTVIQYLASGIGQKLIVFNMSQQSDSSDLLGGFKPVDIRVLANPLKETFNKLFEATFSVKSNYAFLESIQKAYAKKKWNHFSIGLKNAITMASNIFKRASQPASETTNKKLKRNLNESLKQEWNAFTTMVEQFDTQREQIKENLLFSFVEGALVKAIREGQWVLLDEINLASAETLECLNGLLQDANGSILLMERGDSVPVKRHSDFRIFACMNPANDAGKRDLSTSLRNRFTEFWIDAPDSNQKDLFQIVKQYLKEYLPPGSDGDQICQDLSEFHIEARRYAQEGLIYDGANQRVHYSMRTLARALSYSMFIAATYGLKRALYEGASMTFLTGLNIESSDKMTALLHSKILGSIKNVQSFVRQIPREPIIPNAVFSLMGTFWMEQGEHEIPENVDENFIITPSVEWNLNHLARAVVSRKYPVLIQGPTSVGKTSIIEYIARKTGHRFVRINNHEHTDIQEYLGSYVSSDNGSLVFQEGVLVEALRKGYWIVLDELNLAPTDVLEALNRLLDDNRELFLPETQEVIKPHPHFMLFATQNPVGQYGGRKQLSRAFRNRFLELHFSDIPENELESILCQRCRIAPSYAKKLVQVYKSLQKSRGKSRIFDGKFGFVTLRDLFRWSLRGADSYQKLGEDGYMILAERMRTLEERNIVKSVLENELKIVIDPVQLYESEFSKIMKTFPDENKSPELKNMISAVVWTKAMKRLFVLAQRCVEFNEPLLLVGETGTGKTTICQILAAFKNSKLHIVNAHQHSETSDFLGSQRPARNQSQKETELIKDINIFFESINYRSSVETAPETIDTVLQEMKIHENEHKLFSDSNVTQFENLQTRAKKRKILFEWMDGPLIHSMKNGDCFLLDEISLADDSVLERLNSVLEPSRLLVLAEKGGETVEEIYASKDFKFFATMNPGGDYGKKELSPALRNRFTEIWVSSIDDQSDLALIVEKKLLSYFTWNTKIIDFFEWLSSTLHKTTDSVTSLRDILAWIEFMKSVAPKIGEELAFFHGGLMTVIDGIGMNPQFGFTGDSAAFKDSCVSQLQKYVSPSIVSLSSETSNSPGDEFGIYPFFIPVGPKMIEDVPFVINAPTTNQNVIRILRGLQLDKPILLEGSPGVGKTSLVMTLASMSGNEVVRINLSEQTDLMDLLGSDLPVEGGTGGQFAWRDGPFLQALQEGKWVLLDELNLASQQVLEGLNACLDHRANIYLPELDRSFPKHPNFRVFGAQNPQSQGGGRKGLPKSFVNRFTLVYIDEFQLQDLQFICNQMYGEFISQEIINKMISFNDQIRIETCLKMSFGWQGSPWEFNLRDVMRWADMVKEQSIIDLETPGKFLKMLYLEKFRSAEDRSRLLSIYNDVFGNVPIETTIRPYYNISKDIFTIGEVSLKRNVNSKSRRLDPEVLQILPSHLDILECISKAVEMNWMPLIIGPNSSGKTSIVRLLSSILGTALSEFSMNSSVDAIELLGGFEQEDITRTVRDLKRKIFDALSFILCFIFNDDYQTSLDDVVNLQSIKENILSSHQNEPTVLNDAIELVKNYSGKFKSTTLISLVSEIEIVYADYKDLLVSGGKGRFRWIDGSLIKAMESGDWILIDNVNLCSTSVIDRLNSLLEKNGVLLVNERGLVNGEVKVVKPHPNFRIFMTMDPAFGEISRAMRNRAVELYFNCFDLEAEQVTISKILNSNSVPQSLIGDLSSLTQGKIKSVSMKGKLIVEQLERGFKYDQLAKDFMLTQLESIPENLTSVYKKSILPANDYLVSNILNESRLLIELIFRGNTREWEFQKKCGVSCSYRQLIFETFRKLICNSLNSDIDYLRLWIEYIRNNIIPRNLWNQDLELIFKVMIKAMSSSITAEEYLQNNSSQNLSGSILLLYRRLFVISALAEYSIDSTKKAREMSIWEQSLNYQKGNLLSSELYHPSVVKIVPFFKCFEAPLFQTIQQTCQNNLLIDVNIWERFFNSMEDIFWGFQAKTFDNSVIVTSIMKFEKCFQILLKSIQPALHLWNTVLNEFVEISEMLNIERIYLSIMIWRYFRPATLNNPDCIDIQTQFKELSSSLDFKMASISDWINHPRFNMTDIDEIRKTIVESEASLFCLEESSNSSQNLKSLQDIPLQMKALLKKMEPVADPSVPPTSVDLLQKGANLGHAIGNWAIGDGIYIQNEYNLITEMIKRNLNSLPEFLGNLQNHFEFGLKKSSKSSLGLHFIKRLIWSLEESLSSSNIDSYYIDGIMYQWHEFLWKNCYGISSALNNENRYGLLNGNSTSLISKSLSEINMFVISQGPSILQSPFFTTYISSNIAFLPFVPVYSIPMKETQLLQFKQYLLTNDLKDGFKSDNNDLINILHLIKKFLFAFKKYFEIQKFEIIIHSLEKMIHNNDIIIDSIEDILPAIVCENYELSKIIGSYIIPALVAMKNYWTSKLEKLGLAYTLVSCAFLEVYLLADSVDPSQYAYAKITLLEIASDSLKAKIIVGKNNEYHHTGHLSNAIIHNQELELSSIQDEAFRHQKKISYRPKISKINELFSDLSVMKKLIIGKDSLVSQWIEEFKSNNNGFSGLKAKELHIQDSILNTIEKLELKYPAYSDLCKPINLALYNLKYGLRVMLNSLNCTNESQEKFLSESMRFINDCETQNFEKYLEILDLNDFSCVDDLQSYISICICALERVRSQTKFYKYLTKNRLSLAQRLFSYLTRLSNFLLHEKEQKELTEAEFYKYKPRNNLIETEDEENEKEFLSLFPDFSSEYETAEENSAPKKIILTEISDSDILKLICIHEDILQCSLVSTKVELFTDYWIPAFKNSYKMGSNMIATKDSHISKRLDKELRSGHLVFSENVWNQSIFFGEKIAHIYDFYNDSNLSEAKKILKIVQSVSSKLEILLQKWPDHVVLGHLLEICTKIVSFPLSSPVMKLLNGLEFLIQKSQDWEKYASRDVSLSVEISAASDCIIHLRKLELSSWKYLLDLQKRKCVVSAGRMWFNLWQSVIEPIMNNISTKSDFQVFSHDLLKLIDEFLLNCTVGEYFTRLDLLKNFSAHLIIAAQKKVIADVQNSELLKAILSNIYQYYSLFKIDVASMVEVQEKEISKNISDFVKLASWKDTNAFALKESAKRSHYQLHKFLKKFRNTLSTPLKQVIATALQKTSGHAQSFPICQNNCIVPNIQPKLISDFITESKWIPKLRTLIKKSELIQNTVINGVGINSKNDALDSLATGILDQVKYFKESASGLVAGTDSSKNERMIRKKSFMDGIKYFETLGLSTRCSYKYAENQDPYFLFTRPVLEYEDFINSISNSRVVSSFSDSANLLQQSNSYYYRLLCKSLKVRESSRSNYGDINEREAEICLSFVDDFLHLIVEERNHMNKFIEQIKHIISFTARLDSSYTKRDSIGSGTKNDMENLLDIICKAHIILTQSKIVIGYYFENGETEWTSAIESCITKIFLLKEKYLADFQVFISEYSPLCINNPSFSKYAYETNAALKEIVELFKISESPFFVEEIKNHLEILIKSSEDLCIIPKQNVDTKMHVKIDLLIESVLVYYQSIRPTDIDNEQASTDTFDEYGMQEKQILANHHSILELCKTTSILKINTCLQEISDMVSSDTNTSVSELLCVFPLLYQLSIFLQKLLQDLISYHKSFGRLSLIATNIADTILVEGFCVPKNAEPEEEEGDTIDDVNGMGIGEGEGKKDVSDEIENEGQVEGLENDEPHVPEDENIANEENGIEMQQDFDGKLEDIDQDDQDESNQSEEDQNEEENLEEEFGDLENKGENVDEKLWEDDDKDLKNEEEQGDSSDPIKSNGIEETVAKPDEEETDSHLDEDEDKTENKDDHKKEKETEKEDGMNAENDDIEENDGDEDDESETLSEAAEDSKQNEVRDTNMDVEEDSADFPDEMNVEENNESDMDENDPSTDDIQNDQIDTDDNMSDKMETDSEEIENDETKDPNQPEEENIEQTDDQDEEQKSGLDDAPNVELPETENDNAIPFGYQGDLPKESNSNTNEELEVQNPGTDDIPDNADFNNTSSLTGEKKNQTEKSGEKNGKETSPTEPNPLRNLGDALKSWAERLRNVSDAIEQSEQAQDLRNEGDEYEFIENDASADAETLDVATQEQMNQILPKQALEENVEDNNYTNAEDIEQKTPDHSNELPDQKKLKKAELETKDLDLSVQNEKPQSTVELLEEEKMEVMGHIQDLSNFSETDFDNSNIEDLHDMQLDDSDHVESYEQLRYNLEQNLSQWREKGRDARVAQEIWQECVQLTRNLSYSLCEQLRLILEPTLASNLKGDYRTGKRLNMRKIIPYIASHFKKDKIWLRRTKPSKRTYQIMIGIDDSKSMAESKSIQLAYESLALITKALSQLEVGEIGLISFGEKVELLHPFNKPFSDNSGTEVVQRFTFNQNHTNVQTMMKSSLKILEEARLFSEGGASGADLWQLQLIISDGVCEDHDQIRAIVRKAAESRIMVVFLVLDNRQGSSSISNMTNVTYGLDKLTQMPTLQMNKYMDTFPFDYFILIKNIETLPEVLSETLRQYFMFTSNYQ